MGRQDSPLRDRLVFLVGARRSGTNWLQRLLTVADGVAAVPSETHLFWDAIPALEQRVQHGLVGSTKTGTTYVPREAFLDATRSFCDVVFGAVADRLDKPPRLLVERTPWHARRLPLITAVYPDAAVVHLVRDPRDVAASLVAQPWGPTTYAEAAAEWVETVTAAHDAGGPRYREVRHEDLLADPAGGLAALFDWLGVPVDASLRERIATVAAVPVNTSRPGAAGTQHRPAPDDVATVEAVAGEAMALFGYEAGSRAARPRSRRLPLHRRQRATPGRPAGPAAAPAAGLGPERAQRAIDRFMAAVAADDVEALAGLMHPDAVVVTDGTEHRGTAGTAALAAALPRHRGLRQRSGEVYAGASSYAVVTVHDEGAGGPRLDEVFVLTVDDGLVGRIVYLRAGGSDA